jgi:Domain of unknown function (DUF6265)
MKINMMLRNLLLCLFVAGTFSACGGNTEGPPPLSRTTRAEITYYSDPEKGNEGEKTTMNIIDPEEALLLTSVLEGDSAPKYKCGYQGMIRFYATDSLIYEAEFNLASDCRHIVFMKDGKLQSVKLEEREVETLRKYRMKAFENQLADLNWFLGTWMLNDPSGKSTEQWSAASATRFAGHSYTMNGKDTVFSETLEMVASDSGVYYIPVVGKQGPIPFKLTKMEPHFVVFENPSHDFPKKITYEAVGDSGLVAVISGPDEKGEPMTVQFPFRRAN